MKTILKSILFTLILFGGSVVAQTTKLISPKEFKEGIKESKNVLILDIRKPSEYARGHLENAININYYDKDFKAQINQLNKNTPTYVYCHSAGRSGHSMKIFKSLGFKIVYDMNKGIVGWNKAKYKTVK